MKRWKPFLLVAAVWLLPGPARAGGFEVAQQSASASGVGSAGTARSADPAAAWYNPAALGRFGKFKVLLDLVVTIWDVYDRLEVEFQNEETDPSIVINEWSTTVSVRAGMEWTPLKWITARLGTCFDQTPIPDRNLYPSSPDSHRVAFTLGVGF